MSNQNVAALERIERVLSLTGTTSGGVCGACGREVPALAETGLCPACHFVSRSYPFDSEKSGATTMRLSISSGMLVFENRALVLAAGFTLPLPPSPTVEVVSTRGVMRTEDLLTRAVLSEEPVVLVAFAQQPYLTHTYLLPEAGALHLSGDTINHPGAKIFTGTKEVHPGTYFLAQPRAIAPALVALPDEALAELCMVSATWSQSLNPHDALPAVQQWCDMWPRHRSAITSVLSLSRDERSMLGVLVSSNKEAVSRPSINNNLEKVYAN